MNVPGLPPRRILLANGPRLLRGLLRRAIQNDPALQIVGEASDPARLPALACQTAAQLVILSLTAQGQLPAGAERLLQACPAVCILALAVDGSRVRVKAPSRADPAIGNLQVADQEISDLSLADLLGMLRSIPGGQRGLGETA
jgi:DNA-binding NarL/FixJ family response regulator